MGSFPVSVIIPAYNERDRLPHTLEKLLNFFNKQDIEFEIVVVDDGSTDQTLEIAKHYQKKIGNLRIFSLKKNRGKGAALARGVSAAEKKWVLLYDADSATPIEELLSFQKHSKPDSQILIASRDLLDSQRVDKQPWFRHRLGQLFIFFRKWMIGLKDIEDTQCGFKLIRTDAAKNLFNTIQTPGFLFDVEILGRARILGLPIQEIGVRWYDVPKSKVKLSHEIPRIFFILWKIRKVLAQFRLEQECQLQENINREEHDHF